MQSVDKDNHKNITKNQHYIPQFYQKQWAYNSNKKVYRLDVNKNRINEVSIKRKCQEINLYEFDEKLPNFTEKEFGKMETKYSKFIQEQIMPSIENKNKKEISIDEKVFLCEFIASLIVRNPYEMKKIENSYILDNVEIKNKTKEETKRIVPRILATIPKKSKIYEKLFLSKTTIFTIPAEKICYSEKTPYLFEKDKLKFLAFPLNPKTLVVFSELDDYDSEEKTDFAFNLYCNLLLNNCDYIYSKNEETLKEFVKTKKIQKWLEKHLFGIKKYL